MIRRTAVIWLFVVFALAANAQAENWPQWRGPTGDAVSGETGLPIAWSEKIALHWKTKLPEFGSSTPAVWGDAIFLTSQQGEKLLLLRLDKDSGKIVWTREVGTGTATREAPKRVKQKFNRWHNMASPSPVTDGKHVVVHFGNGDLATYDYDGKQLWSHNLQKDYGPYTIWWGHANSPVIHKNLVISVCMQDSIADLSDKPAASYLVAHDLTTGRVKWKQMRMTKAKAEQCDSYTTPILRKTARRTEVIVMGGNQLDGYDAASGRQLWYLPGIVGGRTITGPTIAHDMVYVTQGMRGPLLAVKLDGEGRRSRRDVAWRYTQGTPDSCTPVVWRDLLFTMADNGVARCFDAHNGRLHWKQRLGGQYKASPLAAEGRIYFLSTDGLCTVVAATTRFNKLAENKLDDTTLASPAVSDGNLLIRGRKHLYCIRK
jgi:outer membrane protein assembly factor BamB